MMFAKPDKQKLFKAATLREVMTSKDITPEGFTVWVLRLRWSLRNTCIDTYNGVSTHSLHALTLTAEL